MVIPQDPPYNNSTVDFLLTQLSELGRDDT